MMKLEREDGTILNIGMAGDRLRDLAVERLVL